MFSEDDVRWGIGICLTRSVRLDDRAGEVVLVPYADLLNHTCECDAYLVWDPALCAVVMRTDRAYNVGDQVGCTMRVYHAHVPHVHADVCAHTCACTSTRSLTSSAIIAWASATLTSGTLASIRQRCHVLICQGDIRPCGSNPLTNIAHCLQVFISYGPKSSGELLLAYGFCPPPGSNPHDAAHVTLAPVGTMREAKLRALYDRGIPGSESFSLRIDALPAGLLPYIAFCAAPAENEQQVLAMAKRLFDECDMDIQLEMLGLDALARHCRKKLVAYPQNLENDKALAASAAHGGGFDKRVALAAAIRVRERQILSRTEFVARQRARQLL
jgi:Rubisco LSMT substrate-binding/SET domain